MALQSSKLRIIQVGLGNWGQSWAKNVVAQNPDVETTAWVEIDAPTLQAAQQRLQLPAHRCFTSFDEALNTVEADTVLITASLPGHVPSAETALRARKHVLIEKPFAPSVAEAERLVELAQQQGKTLMVSQNYRFFPVVVPVQRAFPPPRQRAQTASLSAHAFWLAMQSPYSERAPADSRSLRLHLPQRC